MQKKKINKNIRKKENKKVGKLVPICFALFILLGVSTYAWFIGIKTVEVSKFDIDIASTDSLYLSMDGETWTYNLNVGTAPQYTGNTNSWATGGLSPVSSVGTMDKAASRMLMYEKSSLTTTPGGYRLLTGKVTNTDTDQDSYVAFDLFIKNLSGSAYYPENNILNEEGIYLTNNSSVKVSTNGGVAGTGIENSIRVAFALIGRVNASTGMNGVSTDVGNITSITCQDKAASTGQVQVTGICRNANIWEPNDGIHVQNAINWYTKSCRTRYATGSDETSTSSYNKNETCRNINLINTEETPTPTYAISRVLTINDHVDIYDGVYNTYMKNVGNYENYLAAIEGKSGSELEAAAANFKLVEYPYFTDTEKLKTGNDRPVFFNLAPNSITKVRVYIYVEGQDIDNYDFASISNKISVNFGFTKERYTENDIDYNGPYTGTIICPEGQMAEGKNCVTECSSGKTMKTDTYGNNYCE